MRRQRDLDAADKVVDAERGWEVAQHELVAARHVLLARGGRERLVAGGDRRRGGGAGRGLAAGRRDVRLVRRLEVGERRAGAVAERAGGREGAGRGRGRGGARGARGAARGGLAAVLGELHRCYRERVDLSK